MTGLEGIYYATFSHMMTVVWKVVPCMLEAVGTSKMSINFYITFKNTFTFIQEICDILAKVLLNDVYSVGI
jgi:hypothetical protein